MDVINERISHVQYGKGTVVPSDRNGHFQGLPFLMKLSFLTDEMVRVYLDDPGTENRLCPVDDYPQEITGTSNGAIMMRRTGAVTHKYKMSEIYA